MSVRLSINLEKELVKKLYEIKAETRIPIQKLIKIAISKMVENPNIVNELINEVAK